MNRTAKPASSHPVAPVHAAGIGAEAAPNGAPAERMRAFAVRMRAEHLAELCTHVGLPVEFDPTGRVCGGIDVHFMWGSYGVVPSKVVVAFNAPINELLVPGQGVTDLCARYNRVLCELRALRDRFELRFGAGSAPPGAEAAQPALTRLERDIQARQTTRLGARVVPLHVLQGEIDFWESYHTYLAAIAARAHGAADEGWRDDDTAEMDPVD